jgi:hypothetical protein
MRRPVGRATRAISSVLLGAQLQACAPTWKDTGRVAPRDVVQEWHPDTVQVWLADGATMVAEPRIVGDSLIGVVEVRGRQERVTYARSEIRIAERQGSLLLVTTPAGDTIRLQDAWDTPDSVGGQRVIAPSPARRAFALHEIGGLRVKQIPRPTERGGGVAAVVPGERLRVTHPDRGRRAASEGVFGGIERDTLTIALDNGRVAQIPLAGITKVEVRTGTKSNALSGLVIGGIGAGAIMGLGAVLYAVEPDDSGSSGCCGKAIILFAAGVIGLGFLVVASSVGVASRSDRWETVQLDALQRGRSQ